MTTRREFLQTTATIAGSLLLPRSLLAWNPDLSFHFLHTETLTSWPVADPVKWSLQHAADLILERAREGLSKLTADDGDRVIRLIVRRCSLNLIEIHATQVTVHHWSSQRADLRPFFKTHGLARPEIEVVLRERKKEVATTLTGDDFLFGDRLAADFPLASFQRKWASRFEQEADDWQAAPRTSSGFAWDGVEDNRIPWAALKTAWRRASASVCQNCDTPTILTNFGNPWIGMFNRSPRFVHVCRQCRRSFRDESVKDVGGWIVSNLDEGVRPDSEMVWDRRVVRAEAVPSP